MTTNVGQLAAALQEAARAISVIPAAELACPDCVRLARKASLLSHLFEEIIEFHARHGAHNGSPPTPPGISPASSLGVLLVALQAVHRFLSMSPQQHCGEASTVKKDSAIQFQYVSWQLQKALENIPYQHFEISDEVHEQTELVCSQLRRAAGKNGSANLRTFSEIYEIIQLKFCGEAYKDLPTLDISCVEGAQLLDNNLQEIVVLVAKVTGYPASELEKVIPSLAKRLSKSIFSDALTTEFSNASTAVGIPDASTVPGVYNHSAGFGSSDASLPLADRSKPHIDKKNAVVIKKHDIQAIPEDFRCPISLEVMRDPVIVSTGQTYERSSIQRWIDGGNQTCPKTQQKLQNLTLTPNYVLRSLIMQWCEMHNFEQPINGRIRKSDGSYIVVSGDRAAINELVNKLRSSSIDEQRSAAADIRSLAKRSTDNRILIAEAGAIPLLVNLLSSDDEKTQEHAVTAVLNLSIYETNKMLIVLAGAIAPIVQVLRSGSMEARENAAAALFSLSIDDANKITIGSISGAIDELVELLRSGSLRGRKDAATALFNLCIYQGNKARAVRAGILAPLHKMLTESSSGHFMVDEALTILSVLVSHNEGKAAITKSNLMPVLIDLLRTGQPRNKENAAAILLALCKKDNENLAYLGRLGGRVPLAELAKNGTDRAMRKANSLLDHLSRVQRF